MYGAEYDMYAETGLLVQRTNVDSLVANLYFCFSP